VTLSTPLSFTHWGQGYQRAEVGLLTKRIVIQGDNASDSNSQGGHIMLRYGYHIVQAVELTRMGQSGVMGRYPLHFHLARFMFGMNVVVSASSIHDCYQRCVSVHETHGITLQDNIGYNTFGHCWFLEDGDLSSLIAADSSMRQEESMAISSYATGEHAFRTWLYLS